MDLFKGTVKTNRHQYHSKFQNRSYFLVPLTNAIYLTDKKSLSRVLYTLINTTGIWEQEENVKNTSRRRVFSTFLDCSQMSGVLYHSVIHGLGFFISFMI